MKERRREREKEYKRKNQTQPIEKKRDNERR